MAFVNFSTSPNLAIRDSYMLNKLEFMTQYIIQPNEQCKLSYHTLYASVLSKLNNIPNRQAWSYLTIDFQYEFIGQTTPLQTQLIRIKHGFKKPIQIGILKILNHFSFCIRNKLDFELNYASDSRQPKLITIKKIVAYKKQGKRRPFYFSINEAVSS